MSVCYLTNPVMDSVLKRDCYVVISVGNIKTITTMLVRYRGTLLTTGSLVMGTAGCLVYTVRQSHCVSSMTMCVMEWLTVVMGLMRIQSSVTSVVR